MAAGQLSKVVEQLRRVVVNPDAAELLDGELLKRYIQEQDATAFEALVRRHGPMVLGVCRRVLHNPHDAEDAFQATFLVLVRKASGLRSPGMVGNWLYGVAYRTALEARAAAARRRAKEAKVLPPTETSEDIWADLRPMLDQELQRLPEKYRAVIVLCDLEGKTRKEAARQLGWPEGTVASRLASARKMLAHRLSRHRLAISGGILAALLSQNASASVPAFVIASTLKAANLLAAGQAAASGGISVKVAALAEGVLKTMLLSKLKIALAVLLAVAVVGCGLSLVGYNLQAADQVEARNDSKKPGQEIAGTPAALRKARFAAARKAFDKVWAQYRLGLRDEEQVYCWSVRVLEAERAVAAKKAERVTALERHLSRMKELEKAAPDRLVAVDPPGQWGGALGKNRKLLKDKDGQIVLMLVEGIRPSDNAILTEFYRAEAEVWLAEAKAQ
jgi:RNA polymerase sigma factor (sigma-70 family)